MAACSKAKVLNKKRLGMNDVVKQAEDMIRKTCLNVYKRNVWTFKDKIVFDYEVFSLETCDYKIKFEFYMSESWYPINVIDDMMKCKQWANPESLQILFFTHGLVRLIHFDNITAYKQELKKINDFNMQRKSCARADKQRQDNQEAM